MSAEAKAAAEAAKAVQEVAKTANTALQITEKTGGFFAEFARPILTQASGIISDRLAYKRAEIALALEAKYQRKLRQVGFTGAARPIPLAVQVPLIEAATLEEDDELQERWANLLANFANGASGVEMNRTYAAVLRELSPFDARNLDAVYAVEIVGPEDRGIRTAYLPERAELAPLPDPTRSYEPDPQPSPEVALSLSNLRRHALIESAMAFWGGNLPVVHQTPFGREFVRACTLQLRAN